jgi:hypothetical protein
MKICLERESKSQWPKKKRATAMASDASVISHLSVVDLTARGTMQIQEVLICITNTFVHSSPQLT